MSKSNSQFLMVFEFVGFLSVASSDPARSLCSLVLCCAKPSSSFLHPPLRLSPITLQTGQEASVAPVVQPSLPDPLDELQLNEDPWGNLLEAATAVNGDDFEWCLVI